MSDGLKLAIVVALSCALATPAVAQAQNLMFVTSVSGTCDLSTWVDAGSATGIAAGDAICQARAAAASLPDPEQYVAWLSDDVNDAYCRVHGFGGKKGSNCGQSTLPTGAGPWMRTDGKPFGARVEELLVPTARVYMTASYNEYGVSTQGATMTGTREDGSVDPFNCEGWTSSASGLHVRLGSSEHTSVSWGTYGDAFCSTTLRLLCFKVGPGPELPPFAEQGRLAFVTSVTGSGELASWADAGGEVGIAAGDAVCRARASVAGLGHPETFKAWLSDGSVDAKDRFINDGPWVRLDGMLLGSNLFQVSYGARTALNVDELGQYHGHEYVWTGTEPGGTWAAETCSDWMDGTSAVRGRTGSANARAGKWTSNLDRYCDLAEGRLYCLSDLALDIFEDGFESGDTTQWSVSTP